MTAPAGHVFVSHASADKATADAVCAFLESRGRKCWIAPRDIPSGASFADSIMGAINSASAMVLVFTDDAMASPHVAREAERAISKKIPVLPLRIGNLQPRGAFEYLLSTTQWLDVAVRPSESELAAIIEALARPAPAARAASAEAGASICVLPFTNVSGDPEQDYFSDGISEDIITDLGKVSALSVVSRNTSFTYKGKPTNVRELARQLGVSHVLEGSVRKAGKRVRITAQLVAADDAHIWTERYVGSPGTELEFAL